MPVGTRSLRPIPTGFFATATKHNPGNNGLKDIVMALRWVQENIRCFNGDPNVVTLWGHSAGASAVHLLAITNKTEGLFNRYVNDFPEGRSFPTYEATPTTDHWPSTTDHRPPTIARWFWPNFALVPVFLLRTRTRINRKRRNNVSRDRIKENYIVPARPFSEILSFLLTNIDAYSL